MSPDIVENAKSQRMLDHVLLSLGEVMVCVSAFHADRGALPCNSRGYSWEAYGEKGIALLREVVA